VKLIERFVFHLLGVKESSMFWVTRHKEPRIVRNVVVADFEVHAGRIDGGFPSDSVHHQPMREPRVSMPCSLKRESLK
jgi:hypothetical protein